MTKQEKIHAVETAIRKALPRLLRDGVGCKYKDGNIEFTLIGFDDVAEVYLFQFKDENGKVRIKYVNRHYFDTIGHDILLTDVLEWLNTTSEEPYALHNGFLIDLQEMNFDTKVDLSKPYLKDQSEELINFLYDLIKE